MYLGSNASIEELCKYSDMPAHVEQLVDGLQQQIATLTQLIAREHRDAELESEQLYFAKQIIDEFESGIGACKSVKQAREFFKRLLDNSMLER